MTITLSGNPISTNQIYRRHGHIIYMSKEGKRLKQSYQWEAKAQWRGPPLTDKVAVDIKLYFKNNLRRDIDNWNKILFDSLTGIVWVDDKQIEKMSIQKLIDKSCPRIEITIL